MEVKDPETQKVLRDGQMLSDGVKGDFWRFVKSHLLARVNLLDSLEATIFESKSDEEIARELKARAASVKMIKEWIAEVEASAEQHSINSNSIEHEEYIIQV